MVKKINNQAFVHTPTRLQSPGNMNIPYFSNSPPRLTAPSAARWFTLLATILLAVSLAQLTWFLLPVRESSDIPRRPVQSAGPGPADARLANTPAIYLFGTTLQGTADQAPPDAPDTSLNLTLRGIFAASRREEAHAIIASGADNEKHYAIGDAVTAGVRIHDILTDRVLLERNGRYETLRLPRERLASTQPNAHTATTSLDAAGKNELRNLRDALLKNPRELMNLGEIQTVVQNGQLRGYRIQPRRHQKLFAEAGLGSEDVITHLNGIPVTDPRQFAALAAQLGNATTLQLSVIRPSGSSEDISIDLN